YETDESKIDQLKRTWMAKNNAPMLFISASQKINIDEFRKELVNQVKKLARPY
ncbi:MAG: GTPase HflX, partial [Bacteroidia bacterium]|nr:GTPase HflX [Bacteroidia bacterium]